MVQKYECVRNLFTQLLSREYTPIVVELSEAWQLRVRTGAATIKRDKPYLGTMPIQVDFYSGGEKKIAWELTLHCYQSEQVRSLKDDEGGYVFLIRSSKSELLFRAMQAAKYTPRDDGMLVTITADINSKKGDTEFTEHMRDAVNHFAIPLEVMGGRMLKPYQISLIDYDSSCNVIIQSSEQILSSTTLVATLKAIYKGELKLQ